MSFLCHKDEYSELKKIKDLDTVLVPVYTFADDTAMLAAGKYAEETNVKLQRAVDKISDIYRDLGVNGVTCEIQRFDTKV